MHRTNQALGLNHELTANQCLDLAELRKLLINSIDHSFEIKIENIK